MDVGSPRRGRLPAFWFPRLSWCAGWLSFAASVMALPLLAGEASAQARLSPECCGAAPSIRTSRKIETHYNI